MGAQTADRAAWSWARHDCERRIHDFANRNAKTARGARTNETNSMEFGQQNEVGFLYRYIQFATYDSFCLWRCMIPKLWPLRSAATGKQPACCTCSPLLLIATHSHHHTPAVSFGTQSRTHLNTPPAAAPVAAAHRLRSTAHSPAPLKVSCLSHVQHAQQRSA
jgi:hypothetical protein